MEIRDEGVVVDSRNFRDRDLIVVLLTPNYGVVRGVFRRARGGRAPRAAAAQVLSHVRCSAYQGPHAEMASIRELDLVRSSFGLASDLKRSTAAAAVAELLLVFCPPGEPASKQFRLAVAVLNALLSGVHPDGAVAYTQLWLLRLGGWLAPLDTCSNCQADLSNGSYAGKEQGLLCESCARGAPCLSETDRRFITSCLTTRPEQLPESPGRALRLWLDGMSRSAAESGLRALDFHRSLENGSNSRRLISD